MAPRATTAPFGLTPLERERYESLVPAVPEEVVAELVHEFGCTDQEDDLLQEAYLGTAKGVQTFDGTKGPLRQWVFFSALHAAQAILRREKRQNSRIAARIWDGAMVYCKGEHRTFGVMGEPEGDRALLTEFRSGAAAASFVGLALLEAPTGSPDELVERATAARCAAGLRQAVGELSGPRRELLRLCFADEQSVKETAATRGEKGYRAELVEFHRTVGLVAARLAGMGFDELPPFPAEAWGTILRESPGTPSAPPAQPIKP